MRGSVVRAGCLWAALVLPLWGCRSSATGTAAVQGDALQHFPVQGKIVGVQGAVVTLAHGAVPGFMEAMTMPYQLKDPSIASELHPGDRITATILVHKEADGFSDPLLDEIVIVAQVRPDYKPAVIYHIPKPGDLVPNFALLNQSGKVIHLDQFRGKLLLLTFIYTRCTVADFCPRVSRNFATLDQQLQGDPQLYGKTHLLSISFDPAYDTPKVLRSYGGAYTGRFTQETFRHWDFAAPPLAELPAVAQWFGVGITPGANGTLSHSLSTALVSASGHVVVWYPSNQWTPAQVMVELKKAAAETPFSSAAGTRRS